MCEVSLHSVVSLIDNLATEYSVWYIEQTVELPAHLDALTLIQQPLVKKTWTLFVHTMKAVPHIIFHEICTRIFCILFVL